MPFYSAFFCLNRSLVRLAIGKDTVPEVDKMLFPAVYIGHHQNMYGPIHTMAWLPGKIRPWSFGKFHNRKAARQHFYQYTFRDRWHWGALRAGFCAFIASLYVPSLLRGARGIPVYRQQRRLLETINESVDTLAAGNAVAVFPDVDYDQKSPEFDEMYAGFLNLEKFYYRRYKQHLPFIPIYCSKSTRQICIGDPVYFADNVPFHDEKKRVAEVIRQRINEMGEKSGDIGVNREPQSAASQDNAAPQR